MGGSEELALPSRSTEMGGGTGVSMRGQRDSAPNGAGVQLLADLWVFTRLMMVMVLLLLRRRSGAGDQGDPHAEEGGGLPGVSIIR